MVGHLWSVLWQASRRTGSHDGEAPRPSGAGRERANREVSPQGRRQAVMIRCSRGQVTSVAAVSSPIQPRCRGGKGTGSSTCAARPCYACQALAERFRRRRSPALHAGHVLCRARSVTPDPPARRYVERVASRQEAGAKNEGTPSGHATPLSARVPFRLSFAGGDAAVPPYSDECGGIVLSATSNRFACAPPLLRAGEFVVQSLDYDAECACRSRESLLSEGQLDLVKQVLNCHRTTGNPETGLWATRHDEARPGSGLE